MSTNVNRGRFCPMSTFTFFHFFSDSGPMPVFDDIRSHLPYSPFVPILYYENNQTSNKKEINIFILLSFAYIV